MRKRRGSGRGERLRGTKAYQIGRFINRRRVACYESVAKSTVLPGEESYSRWWERAFTRERGPTGFLLIRRMPESLRLALTAVTGKLV